MKKNMSLETLAVHSTYEVDSTGATNPPIYLSNAFHFKDADYAAGLFDLTTSGYIYTRLHNPTTTVLEETIAALEGGVAAVACASGQFAEFMVFASIAKNGENVVCSNLLYGGTHTLFTSQFDKFGIEFRLVNPSDFELLEQSIDEKTKAIYIESFANPSGFVADIQKIADIAHKYNIPLIVDNTIATPYLCRPIEYGADIVIHSATKYLTGNADVLGGFVIDSGNFEWEKSGKFPELTTPDQSYHGTIFTQSFGKAALAVKLRVGALRDVGGTISPFNSFLILQGIQTLHVRMDRHIENTIKLANYLLNHPKIAWVKFNGFEDSINYSNVQKYLKGKPGAMFVFGVKGGYEGSKKFIENVTIPVHATNIGDVKTIVTHPASTTHRQLSDEALKNAGISKDLIRISVGIENINDIIKDFDNTLNL